MSFAKIEIDLPDEDFKKYFEYLKTYFHINIKEYVEEIVKNEVFSRNLDLNLL